MKISASIHKEDGTLINEAKPFYHESDGTIPTVIHVPIVVGFFRRRKLRLTVRIEP